MDAYVSVFIENMGNFKYEIIYFLQRKSKKRVATGQYLHKANLSQIYSFINNQENIQHVEKNKAPVIQYMKTLLEAAATVNMETSYCCDHMH